ncbi:MAG: hypothetical protein VCA73_08490 [Roseibacillus sp.]
MARRRRRGGSGQGNLDSLLDTMTNVVGVLIVVLIVTQVNVSSAAKRIRADLPDVTVAMMEEMVEKDEQVRKRLEELKKPQEVTLEELNLVKKELRTLLARWDLDRAVEKKVTVLEEDLENLQMEIEALQQKLEAEGGELAQIRNKLKEGEEQLAEQKPKMVRLPNPRTPEEGSKEVRMIVRGGRLLHFDRAGILDRLAAKITPRKDLLSRDPKMKNRYDRAKITKFLETLKESDPEFRFDFIVHQNGTIHLHCYPRDGKGEAVEDLQKPGARGRRVMAQAFGDHNYLRYFVTRDSFEDYVAVRRMAEKIQIPVGWIFADDTARQTMNLAERKIIAEPHPDWKPPEKKPGPAPPPPKKKPTVDILD